MILLIQNTLNLVNNNNNLNVKFNNIENYLANSVQLKHQATYIFNGQVHSEKEIAQKVEEISKIKNLPSPNFKHKLKTIFMKANRITKYKKDLTLLYEEKIDKNDRQHMNMLFDIWNHFMRNDRNIREIDKKWGK